MKNATTLTVLIFFLSLLACKKESPVQSPDVEEMYTPYLKSNRDDGKVTLKWGKPICTMCLGCPCPELEPEQFEILMSDTDPSGFSVHSVVNGDVFELSIENLVNETPYYFAIRALGHDQVTQSPTIMTIPGLPETTLSLFPSIDKNKVSGTWSPNEGAVAYVSNFIWNNGNNALESVFAYSFSGNSEVLIEKSSRSPEWSPTGSKIVYQTDNGEVNTGTGFPTHIGVYNTSDSTTQRLTGGNTYNWQPIWSPDGKWIAFLSNRAKGKARHIWKIPSDSGSAIQITTDANMLNDLGFIRDRSPKSLSWSMDGMNIAFAGVTKANSGQYNSDIYTVPSNGGVNTPLIVSPWGDYAPAYSPDGTSIAFVSNRSGSNEIWMMHLQSGKLRQITNIEQKEVDTEKIAWSSTGDKIIFTLHSADFSTLYSVVVK